MELSIDLTHLPDVTNKRFYPLYKNKYRHLHLYGGAGSSKSWFIAQKWLARILVGFETGVKHKIVALRKTQPAVRKSVYTVFERFINDENLQAVAQCFTSDLSIRFVNGSVILCTGLDDPQKLKSIEGVTGFLLEEANEFTKDDLRQIDLRMRGETQTYKQITYAYNPVDMNHHLYNDIHKKAGDCYNGPINGSNIFLHHSTYKDNRFIDKEYIDILEGLKDEDAGYYKIYTQGKWGALKNLIYQGWQSCQQWPDNFDDECYGLDFGYNNPSALLFVGIYDQVPYLKEIIYERKLTNTKLIELMRSLNIPEDKPIYADGSEPDRIEEIYEAGFDIKPAIESRKPNAVKARLDFCKRSHFQVDPYSENILKELSVYKYKEDREGNVSDDPVKFMDHAMNAFEYGYYEHCRLGQTSPGIAFIK